jgi:hypothetical protein
MYDMKRIFFLMVFLIPLSILSAQDVLPGYNGFWSSNKKISVLDILDYYPDRLPYLRNEIYARYGRAFVTQTYQDYFDQHGWYTIRSNYTDDWLSSADKYNAELIRAIEQAPSAADTLALLQRKNEYRSQDRIFIFTASEVLEEEIASSDIYGRNTHSPKQYVVVGDWVVIHEVKNRTSSSKTHWVKACRLNHGRQTVIAMAEGYVARGALIPLIQDQIRLR